MTRDPNFIFSLRAIGQYAEEACKVPHNRMYYVPPPPLIVTATSRESSVVTNPGDGDREGDGGVREDLSHQLRFTFDLKPKNIQDGYVFGSNAKTCDVIVGNPRDGISGFHFRVTFDKRGRLMFLDSSTHGTAVSYNGQARKDKRKNPLDRTRNRSRNNSNDFAWILFPRIENKRVVIGEDIEELPGAPVLEFSLEVAIPREQNTNLLQAYLHELQMAVPFSLNIDSHPTTAGQTGSRSPTQRPRQRPIWIDLEEIGKGEFATVYRAVDVSTAGVYAAKMLQRSGEGLRERWDSEVAILRKVSHDHIVKFVDHITQHTRPRLIMEYLPLGNLSEQRDLSQWETVTLLHQGLAALSYLHSCGIVHRDLKPKNILVQCRDHASFRIKIADFGLVKVFDDGSFLKTCCGTPLYTAPEMWIRHPYTAKVDIWSLGLIAFEYAYNLPEVPNVQGHLDVKCWYRRLARAVDDWESDDLVDFLSSSMLQEDPLERLTAGECLQETAKLLEAISPVQNPEIAHIGGPSIEGKWIQQGVMSSARDRSEADAELERSKGSRIETPADNSSNSHQQPWKRWQELGLHYDPLSDCIQFLVGSKAVSMRKKDCWLNATSVIALTNKTRGEKDSLLRKLKRHTDVQVPPEPHPRQSWIPFQDGHYLCHFLQLTAILQPLLTYGSEQVVECDDRGNYFLVSTKRRVAMPKLNPDRPRCKRCQEGHKRCDRGDQCGNCKASDQDCIYESKLVAKARQQRAEPIPSPEPVQLLPGPAVSEGSASMLLDEEGDEESDEETEEETDEGNGLEELSQHTSDKRTTSHVYQSTENHQDVTHIHDDPATAAVPAGNQDSNLTEPSVPHGSFLPPLNASFLEPAWVQHQPGRDSSFDSAALFENDETWLDAAIRNSMR